MFSVVGAEEVTAMYEVVLALATRNVIQLSSAVTNSSPAWTSVLR